MRLLLIIIFLFIISTAGTFYLYSVSKEFSNIRGLFTSDAKWVTCKCLGKVEEYSNPAADPSYISSCIGITLPFSCKEEQLK